ncbi:battenin-like [Agrilus planipennis]|uniref:Battenin n=1 Tax=Agrilus planipennis TaxID=224129 RepID=A0A7F5R8Q1_AGRPL|nr:battenin-like [Agrilus planipennis]XP_025832348.1 battenin-like [Agrilus planipennis]
MNNENYELQQRHQASPTEGPSSQISKKGTFSIFKNSEFKTTWRPLVAYWLLGLCNNYGYVVMLTAANDILSEESEEPSNNSTDNPERECNYMSTGAILLADILPSLLIKITAPFLPFFVK